MELYWTVAGMENRHLRSLSGTRYRSWITLKEIKMRIRDVIFLGAMFGSATVGADPSVVTSTVRVSHINLNPLSPSEALHTLDRLRDAALEACGGSPFSLAEFRTAIRASKCWHESLADVVARVGNAQLNLAFKSHGD
jgi:UrcA family protein